MPGKLTVDMSGLNAAMEEALARFKDRLDAMLAERDAAHRCDGDGCPIPIPSAWQPIATAPKDGTPILGRTSWLRSLPDSYDYAVVQWCTRYGTPTNKPNGRWILMVSGADVKESCWHPDEWAPIPQ